MVERSLWAPRRDPETPEEIAEEAKNDAECLRLSQRLSSMTPEEAERLKNQIKLLSECIESDRRGRIKGHNYEISEKGYVCTRCGDRSNDGIDHYALAFSERPIDQSVLETVLD